MNTPAQQREQKIEAAEKARDLINGLGQIDDLNARATVLHDRVSEGIRTICVEDQCFDEKQIATLTSIAVHLALLFDKDLQKPTGPVKSLWHEFKHFSGWGKIAALAGLVTLLIGIGTIGVGGYQLASGTLFKSRSQTDNVQANQQPLSNTEQNTTPTE